MLNWMIGMALRNRALTVAAYVAVFVVGILAVRSVPLDVFPDFAPPQVLIQTEAPGLAPQDVERLVTLSIETAINGTPGVDVIRSRSSAGISLVTVIFAWGTDIYRARQLVAERLQTAKDTLPASARDPAMLPVTSAVGWLLKYALVSDTVSPLELRTISEWQIGRRLMSISGVASVVSIGGQAKQYQVLLSSNKLWRYGLTVQDVTSAVRKANINVPGGFQTRGGQEFVVTGIGRITSLVDLGRTVVTERGGTPITLDEVASIRIGPEFPRGDASYMGQSAVIGTVSKLYGADTLAVTYRVEEALGEIRRSLPPGVALHTHVFRQASFIESATANLLWALLTGGVIVAVVVIFFLFNTRASLITLLAMPLSLLMGVLVLRAFGVSVNAMTLGGLAIAIGAVVDDAIIAIENIVRRLRFNAALHHPQPSMRVILESTREIYGSVVYATVIILIVFMPIFLLSGIEGRIFTPLGLAFTASLFASLVVALTLTPVLASLLLGSSAPAVGREGAIAVALKRGYERVLRQTLRHPVGTVTAALALFVLSALAILTFGRSFLPEFFEGNLTIEMTAPPGTSLDESMRLGQQITRMLRRHPEVVSVAQRAGRTELDEEAQAPNFSEFDVTIKYVSRDPDQLVEAIREDLEGMPGVVFKVGQFISDRISDVLSGTRADVAIKLYGPDLERLHELGQRIETVLRSIRGIRDLQLEPQIRVPEVRIEVNRLRAGRFGLAPGDVLAAAQLAFNGEVVSRVMEGERTFPLFVWFDEESRRNPDAMRNLLIDTAARKKVPLRAVAGVEVADGPYLINRERIQRRVLVQANVEGRDLVSVVREAQTLIGQRVPMPADYTIEYGGQFASQQESTRVLLVYGSLALGIALLLLVKAFGSVRSALIVVASLPLALIGGVIAIFMTGRVMSVSSLIGFIGVLGIAARNGIILVSHYRDLRAAGKSREDTVVEGSRDRLVPVLMTAAAAAFGLLPLIFGAPAGKEIQRPMAQVILGGLFTSTILTLIVVPAAFARFGWERDETLHSSSATSHREARDP